MTRTALLDRRIPQHREDWESERRTVGDAYRHLRSDSGRQVIRAVNAASVWGAARDDQECGS